MSLRQEALDEATNELVEVFRTALQGEKHMEWDMETVSSAAHICAAAIIEERLERVADIAQLHATLFTLLSVGDGPLREAAMELAQTVLCTIDRTVPPMEPAR